MGKQATPTSQKRLTVSLAPGQRDALESIAAQNGTTLAYVVRCALREFLQRHTDGQLPLRFSRSTSGEEAG